MQLILNEDYIELRQEMKDILRDSFVIMQDVLGLTQHQEGLELELRSPYSGGTIVNAAAYVNGSSRYPVQIKCRSTLSILEAIATLAHEMVHVADIVAGHLKADDEGVFYKGNLMSSEAVEFTYNSGSQHQIMTSLPHEYEAYTLGPLVAKEVFKRLPVRYLRTLAKALGLLGYGDAADIRNALCRFAEIA